MPGAYMTGLIAQQGGAADQQVQNYKDAIAAKAQLDALNQQQKQFDAQQAQSQKQFQALQGTSDRDFQYKVGQDAATKAAQDLANGVGIAVPPGLIPKNHGKQPTPAQKFDNAMTLAAFYASKGAYEKASDYRLQAQDFDAMAKNQSTEALSAQRESALEQYRAQTIAQKTQLHNSDEQFRYTKLQEDMQMKVATLSQRGSEFNASFGQKDRIANMSQADRVYVAQLAAANAMNIAGVRAGATLTKDQSDNAMRAALNQYDQEMSTYRSQGNSLNAGFRADAMPGTFQDPSGGQGVTNNFYAGQQPPQPYPTAPMIPGANGGPPIPPNPAGAPPPGPPPPANSPAASPPAPAPPAPKPPAGTWTPNPYSPAAVQPDPAVDHAVAAVVGDWAAAKAKHGATPQNLGEKVKAAFPALTDAQVATVVARALAKLGLPQPIVGPTEVRGPANPFPQATP